MRVITGKARGVQLKTPAGMLTRPTTDRVKEALFSIIHFDIPGAKVLDLGCGSGILAIAAARLGATDILAIDIDPDAVKVAKENVALNGVEKQVRVVVGDLCKSEAMPCEFGGQL